MTQPLTDEQLAAIRHQGERPSQYTAATIRQDYAAMLSALAIANGRAAKFEAAYDKVLSESAAEAREAHEVGRQSALAEVHRLRAELAAAQGQLAGVWPCTCGHLPRQHDHDAVLGRDFCRGCPADTDLHDYTPEPAKES